MDKRNSHISTFSGGMDRDTNFANMPKEKYYELKNGRVVVNNYSNSEQCDDAPSGCGNGIKE